jgi:hypothetical protein
LTLDQRGAWGKNRKGFYTEKIQIAKTGIKVPARICHLTITNQTILSVIMQIYVSKDNEQFGPFTMEELQSFVIKGNFTKKDLACSDGQNWQKISELSGWKTSKAKKTKRSSSSGKKKIIVFSFIGISFALLATGIFLLWSNGNDREKEKGVETGGDNDEILRKLAILQKEIDQKNEFLDEQVENGYSILQSTKEAQWRDISDKNRAFWDIFYDNQPVGLNDENPLENTLNDLKTSEAVIWRGIDYRDKFDQLAREFGHNITGIASLKDPFSDEKKFPKEDVKLDDGKVIPAVPRENRLRTVMGMLYKDRNDKYNEISILRSKIVERDMALRESQNLFIEMKTQRDKFRDQVE